MQKACEVAISKSKSAVLAAMMNVHFAATHELANTIVPHLNKLCIDQGASQLKDLKVDAHTTYEHHSSIDEFQLSLAQVVEDRLVDRVRKSGVFSVMLDESTDVSVHQNMVVYVRILDQVLGKSKASTHFLGIRQLASATADSITSEVVQLLKDKGIDISGLVGVATDGASVMVGCKKGVVTQLKEVCPGLIGIHCIAHRLALASGAAADSVRYLVKFQEVLNSMYKYFEFSPKNMARLEAVQSVVEEMKSTRLKQVFHTRWLSFQGSVQSVVDNFPGLVSVFLEDKAAKALCMHKSITNYKFLYTAHFLADVLHQLCVLCKAYQRSDISFTDVEPLLRSTVDVLVTLKDDKSGENLGQFLKVAPSEPVVDGDGLLTFEFRGHTIRDSGAQRSEAVSACDSFVSRVVENLKGRFTSQGDTATLSAVSQFFTPGSYLTSVSDEVLDEMVSYLGRSGVSVSDILCRQELVGFRAFAKVQIESDKEVFASSGDVAQVAIRARASFPMVAAAAERLLVIPVSTVDCERGFSRQNLIKTNLRNTLCIKNLENLMRLAINQEEMDFDLAFRKWATAKQRRILMPRY
jgi:hypothetical protein